MCGAGSKNARLKTHVRIRCFKSSRLELHVLDRPFVVWPYNETEHAFSSTLYHFEINAKTYRQVRHGVEVNSTLNNSP